MDNIVVENGSKYKSASKNGNAKKAKNKGNSVAKTARKDKRTGRNKSNKDNNEPIQRDYLWLNSILIDNESENDSDYVKLINSARNWVDIYLILDDYKPLFSDAFYAYKNLFTQSRDRAEQDRLWKIFASLRKSKKSENLTEEEMCMGNIIMPYLLTKIMTVKLIHKHTFGSVLLQMLNNGALYFNDNKELELKFDK